MKFALFLIGAAIGTYGSIFFFAMVNRGAGVGVWGAFKTTTTFALIVLMNPLTWIGMAAFILICLVIF